jgi:hypothetical protein
MYNLIIIQDTAAILLVGQIVRASKGKMARCSAGCDFVRGQGLQ